MVQENPSGISYSSSSVTVSSPPSFDVQAAAKTIRKVIMARSVSLFFMIEQSYPP